jgi:hypothetical protein
VRLLITLGGVPSARVRLFDEAQALGIGSHEYCAAFVERVDALRDTAVTLLRHLRLAASR